VEKASLELPTRSNQNNGSGSVNGASGSVEFAEGRARFHLLARAKLCIRRNHAFRASRSANAPRIRFGIPLRIELNVFVGPFAPAGVSEFTMFRIANRQETLRSINRTGEALEERGPMGGISRGVIDQAEEVENDLRFAVVPCAADGSGCLQKRRS
jgi:hypothetical protein